MLNTLCALKYTSAGISRQSLKLHEESPDSFPPLNISVPLGQMYVLYYIIQVKK